MRVPPGYRVVLSPLEVTDSLASPDTLTVLHTEDPQVPEVVPKARSILSDTIREHYYSNGSVSVRIHTQESGERLWELFDLQGRCTYTAREVFLSYTVSLRVSFHENGAVKTLHEHMNPGASMYMYQAEMTFDSTNQPLWKHVTRTPSYGINERFPGGGYFYWCKQQNTWRPKEVIRETH